MGTPFWVPWYHDQTNLTAWPSPKVLEYFDAGQDLWSFVYVGSYVGTCKFAGIHPSSFCGRAPDCQQSLYTTQSNSWSGSIFISISLSINLPISTITRSPSIYLNLDLDQFRPKWIAISQLFSKSAPDFKQTLHINQQNLHSSKQSTSIKTWSIPEQTQFTVRLLLQ